MMTGPAIGGGIIAAAGIDVAYAVFVALSLGAYVSMLLLHYEQTDRGGKRGMSLTAIRDGIRYVRTHQVVIGSMTLDMCAVIFGGAQALLPVYAEDILHVGSLGYGILYASLDAGAFLMSILIVFRPPIVRAGRALICAVFVYGLFTVLFGVSREFVLSVACYATDRRRGRDLRNHAQHDDPARHAGRAARTRRRRQQRVHRRVEPDGRDGVRLPRRVDQRHDRRRDRRDRRDGRTGAGRLAHA